MFIPVAVNLCFLVCIMYLCMCRKSPSCSDSLFLCIFSVLLWSQTKSQYLAETDLKCSSSFRNPWVFPTFYASYIITPVGGDKCLNEWVGESFSSDLFKTLIHLWTKLVTFTQICHLIEHEQDAFLSSKNVHKTWESKIKYDINDIK